MSCKIRRAKRVRLARIGLSASALAAMALPVKLATPVEAKTPGLTYCYHGTCHRVKTIAETQALVGVEETILASHYDDCSRDRYNPCGLTSSGEQFHPDRPDNTASPIYPDGTTLLVWSPETEQALIVRVNNAGPYWGERKLDLSRAAAERLGFEGQGVAKVRVRVIKAPEPWEARYVANRSYPAVPGDIGRYASLEAAQSGMAVALALQATAASPLAPVTTANAFARQEAGGLLVAEAPQALGRGVQVASATPRFTLGLGTQYQSRPQLAALSIERVSNQSPWGEDVLDEIAPRADTDSVDASTEPAAVAEAGKKPERDPATQPAKVASFAESEKKPESESEAARRTKVASLAEANSEPARKPSARRHSRSETGKHASRKSHAHNERRSRTKRTASSRQRAAPRARIVYADRPRFVAPERSAGQQMSLGIRAQSSSTM